MNWNEQKNNNFWKNYLGRENEFQGERAAEEIFRLTKRFIKGKVLDIGAGSGALLKLIPDAQGIDLIPRKGIIQGNITKLPFPSESFQTVFATEVLEHLSNQDLEQGLKEVNRCLKLGGYFIATTPYEENLEERMVTCPECGAHFHRVQHQQAFNKERMRKLFNQYGYSMIKISQEPYDFSRKIGKWTIKYKHIRWLKPLLNKMKKGNLLVIAKKSS